MPTSEELRRQVVAKRYADRRLENNRNAAHRAKWALNLLPPEKVLHPAILDGVIEHRFVESAHLNPGIKYLIVRFRSGWTHVDTRCLGWLHRGDCHHLQEARAMNQSTALSTVLSPNALELIDELDALATIEGIGEQITRAWVYEFRMEGQTIRGLSAAGVEEAGRQLAIKGEAIREIDCRLEYEDDREARFLAQAGRFAIDANGGAHLLDTVIRGKRVGKYEKRADGKGEYFNKFWYEHGVTKANRNAKRAFLPQEVVAFVTAKALATPDRVFRSDGSASLPSGSRGALPRGRAQAPDNAPPPSEPATQPDVYQTATERRPRRPHPDTPETAPKATVEQRSRLEGKLREIRQSAGEIFYNNVYQEMKKTFADAFNAEGKLALDGLTFARAGALLIMLRAKNGEPVDQPTPETPATDGASDLDVQDGPDDNTEPDEGEGQPTD